MVKSDLVEAVVGLGPGLFYNSPMEAVVITLRSTKPAQHRGRVLFINAVNEYARKQAQSFLRENHQNKILNAYQAFADQDGFAATATLDEIAGKAYSLAIPRYVVGVPIDNDDDAKKVGVVEALTEWRTAAEESDAAVLSILDQLRREVPAP